LSGHVALLSSCRASWLLSRLLSHCPLVLSSRRHLVFSSRLSSSSRYTALSSSHCAGWLSLRRLSSRRRLVLSLHHTLVLLSFSHCAALLPSNCTGWLFRRLLSFCRLVLSSRRHLVLSSSSYCAVLLSSNRTGCCPSSSYCTTILSSCAGWLLFCLSLRRPLILSSRCPLVLSLCAG